jgi:hypothetical protein
MIISGWANTGALLSATTVKGSASHAFRHFDKERQTFMTTPQGLRREVNAAEEFDAESAKDPLPGG